MTQEHHQPFCQQEKRKFVSPNETSNQNGACITNRWKHFETSYFQRETTQTTTTNHFVLWSISTITVASDSTRTHQPPLCSCAWQRRDATSANDVHVNENTYRWHWHMKKPVTPFKDRTADPSMKDGRSILFKVLSLILKTDNLKKTIQKHCIAWSQGQRSWKTVRI